MINKEHVIYWGTVILNKIVKKFLYMKKFFLAKGLPLKQSKQIGLLIRDFTLRTS
jgi:hypothetical protein